MEKGIKEHKEQQKISLIGFIANIGLRRLRNWNTNATDTADGKAIPIIPNDCNR